MATTVSYSASLCTRHTNSSSNAKNGYASQMLCMTLEKAKERGISKVRICCDHYNIASAKTIQSNGGVLEDEMFDSSDGMLTQRYWIENR
mgnify:CR=1 FL=1